MAVAMVLLAGCAEIPDGSTFSDDAERVAVLQGSTPCDGGICWLGGNYHPALEEAKLDLVLGMEQRPRNVHLSEGVYFWMQGSPAEIYAFDAQSKWLYQVWNKTDGRAYDLHVHNGTASFVTASDGTLTRPHRPTTLRTWNLTHREAEVATPLLRPFGLVGVGSPGWVVVPWAPGVSLHEPEAFLVHRSGWLEQMVEGTGGTATVDAAFADSVVYVAVNAWDEEHFTVTSFSATGGLHYAVRADSSTAALDLVTAPDRLAFAALAHLDAAPELREVRFSQGIELDMGPGRPVGYLGVMVVANRPVDGGNTIQARIGDRPPTTLVDVVPGLTTEAVAMDGGTVVVRVDGPFHALAVTDLNSTGHVH